MSSLVLFTGRNPKTSTVICGARVRLIENGPKASIKWYNGKSYVANVLRTSDDERVLSELTVLTSGKIENEKIPQSGNEEIPHQFLHPAPSESSPSTASSAPTEESSSPPATSTDEDSLNEQSSTQNVSTTIEEQVPTSSSPDDLLKPSAATTNEKMLPPSSTTSDNNSPPDEASTSHGEHVPCSSPPSTNNSSTTNAATTTEEHVPSSSTPNDKESQPRETTPTIQESVPASVMPNDVDSRTVPVVIREERREQQSTKQINISISLIVPNVDKDARTGITAQRGNVPSHIEAHAVPPNIQPSASRANTMKAGPE